MDVALTGARLVRGPAEPYRFPWTAVCAGQDVAETIGAELAGVSDSAVSHQLRILRNLGLVSFRRDGKKALYSLSDEHLKRILEQSMEHVKER